MDELNMIYDLCMTKFSLYIRITCYESTEINFNEKARL
jgi:hypothetical protein